MCTPHVVRCGRKFRSHAAFTEGAFSRQAIGFIDAHGVDRALLVRAPSTINGVDIRENQEKLGAQLSRKHCGSKILVDDGIDPLEAEHSIAVDGNSAATAGDHYRVALEQRPDRRKLVDCQWAGTSDYAAEMAFRILRYRMTLCALLARACHRESMPNEFLRIPEGGVVGRDLHLCENGHYIRRAASFAQCILQ
jgi:hypothetical protein